MYSIFVYGLVITVIITYILKQTIKGERPEKGKKEYADGGMPSGHASMIAYILFFIAFYFNNPLFYPIAIIGTIYIAKSRVDQEYHTVAQTVVGAIIGIAIAFYFTHFYSLN
jgi:membrane-associated phospholipid phosphatase